MILKHLMLLSDLLITPKMEVCGLILGKSRSVKKKHELFPKLLVAEQLQKQ